MRTYLVVSVYCIAICGTDMLPCAHPAPPASIRVQVNNEELVAAKQWWSEFDRHQGMISISGLSYRGGGPPPSDYHPYRMQNNLAIVRGQLVFPEKHLHSRLNITDLEAFIHSEKPRLLEDGKSVSVRDFVVYLPNAAGPIYGFGGRNLVGKFDASSDGFPYRRIKVMSVFLDRFEPKLLHVRPFHDALFLGTYRDFDYSPVYARETWIQWKHANAFSGWGPYEANYQRGFIDHHDKPILVKNNVVTLDEAYLIARHYASIVDVEGKFEIAGLEAGRKLEFQLFHPKISDYNPGGLQLGELDVNKDGRFELTLKEGINDLGLIDVSLLVRYSISRQQRK